MSQTKEEVSASGTEGSLPLLGHERNWTPKALFFSSSQTAVATWCFIIGGYVAFYLPAVQGSIVMIASMMAGMLLVYLATVPMATRYGLEAVRSTRPVFGTRGSLFAVALTFLFTVGWGTTLMIFSGKSASLLLITLGVVSEGNGPIAETLSSLICLAVVWGLISRGPGILRRIGVIVACSVLVLGVMVIVVIVAKVGVGTLLEAKPSAASGNKLLDYTTAVELMLATALSWWPFIGGMTRFSKSTKKSVRPVTLGLGLSLSVICLIGLYTGLAFPDSGGNPVPGLLEIGGVWVALPAFAFIIIANIGTTMVGTYTAALSLKQQPAIDSRLSWRGATTTAVLTAAVLIVFLAEPFYNNFGAFLTLSGVVFGPLCGLQIVDYFIIRKQRLDLDGLYKDGPGTAYWYWKGINVTGFASMTVGIVVYLLLLDPITFASAPLFAFTTASLPATVSTAIIYVLLARLQPKAFGPGAVSFGARDALTKR
ncbi:purine-cytosine permease family protein [Arthrobacter sp. 35W]|uniref:purine-cytosine permease family protein n=1 Tax=Arthrobacter sp. 35W TaxID=1132441 RepID=UPI000404DE04|nr:cytosine permease [Arthrobacter sp. 35W]